MALFFFGTLMDLDVMTKVLGRAVEQAELVPATLPGWRRVRALNASYPIIVPEPGSRVAGLLFLRPSVRDLIRIRHFESEEYEPTSVTVERADGGMQRADVFVALEAVFETDGEPWNAVGWAAEHKAGFLIRCDAWMADCPPL